MNCTPTGRPAAPWCSGTLLAGTPDARKSTLAYAREVELQQRGLRTYLLDGDYVRDGRNRDLGLTEADRVKNIRRLAEVALLTADAGLVVLTAFI